MGYWTFIFNHAEWYRVYSKNCTLRSIDDWNNDATGNIPLGIIYILIGIFCELIYIPFIVVMLKHEFIQHTCYKFMFLLSLIDICTLPCNAIVSGVQDAFGLHYCTNPTLFYLAGALGTCCWYGGSTTCVILGLDRFLEMCKPKWARVVFNGKIVYLWLIFPILYMLFAGFQLPAFYNNRVYSYNFDPFAGSNGYNGYYEFTHFPFHCFHNFFVSFALAAIYSGLCIVLLFRAKMYKSVDVSKHQKLMTLQSFCICFEIFVAALVYIYNQFFTIPSILSAMAHIAWICIHGDTPIVYLCLNASLRKSVFRLLKSSMGRSPWHAYNSVMNAPSYFVTDKIKDKHTKTHSQYNEDLKF